MKERDREREEERDREREERKKKIDKEILNTTTLYAHKNKTEQ